MTTEPNTTAEDTEAAEPATDPFNADALFDDRPTPEAIIAEALEKEGPVIRTYCLFSGGGDSIVVAHRCRHLYDELVHIDTGTALPGVREHVEYIAATLKKPLRVYENGPEPYRKLVLGDDVWWERFRDARHERASYSPFSPELTIAEFIRADSDRGRKPGDGLGNAPQGFPGPGGGHRAAYARLKERQVEALVRDTKAELGAHRNARVALLSGARIPESRRRRRTQSSSGTFRARKAQLWINPLQFWENDEMRAYRRDHSIRVSDVAALLHRSGECNCGAYIAKDERDDVLALFGDWYAGVIAPLEEEARALGIPRCVWGERADSGRPGARGAAEERDDGLVYLPGLADYVAGTHEPDLVEDEDELPLCSDCVLRFEGTTPA